MCSNGKTNNSLIWKTVLFSNELIFFLDFFELVLYASLALWSRYSCAVFCADVHSLSNTRSSSLFFSTFLFFCFPALINQFFYKVHCFFFSACQHFQCAFFLIYLEGLDLATQPLPLWINNSKNKVSGTISIANNF